MPHKRNPVSCEQVTGIARVVRANAFAAMENIPLWHERDITHSSVERIIIPDSTIALDYIAYRMTAIIENLIVYPDRMLENIQKTNGLVFSQAILLALARKGVTSETAYRFVQRNAMKVWETRNSFQETLLQDKDIRCFLSEEEVRECFDLNNNLKNVDFIFSRVGLAN